MSDAWGNQGVSKRIVKEHIDVDYQDVSKFFEDRGKNEDLAHKYNYVLFQDENPELAVQRDQQEKNKISGLLELRDQRRVLDIGCGIGRWGEKLCANGLYYVGIDGSSALIARAKDNLQQFSNKKLLAGMVQDFPKVLHEAGEEETFDLIFVNGVFMYVNDTDFEKALLDIKGISGSKCQIYIKESMGLEDRLTLSRIYSEGLKQQYSAIYRSIAEYRQSMIAAWGDVFQLLSEGELFDNFLHNRKETTDYYMIWKRK